MKEDTGVKIVSAVVGGALIIGGLFIVPTVVLQCIGGIFLISCGLGTTLKGFN